MNVSLRFDAEPKIFVNSLPKSGTNLLTSILALIPCLKFQRLPLTRILRQHPLNQLFFFSNKTVYVGIDQPTRVKFQTLEYTLKKLKQGCFATGHIPYQSLVVDLLNSSNIRTMVVVRDPRDVTVSLMHYNIKQMNHFLHKKYVALSSDKERLKAAILGIQKPNGKYLNLGIAEKIASVLPWTRTEGVMSIRFEDIIGPQGAGDLEKQLQSILHIATHIGIDLTEEQAVTIGEKMYGTGRTFRKGVIGDWKNHYDEELKEIFKKTSGQYLIELGYEQDLNW